MANNSTNRTTTSHLELFLKNTTTYGVGHIQALALNSQSHICGWAKAGSWVFECTTILSSGFPCLSTNTF